MPASRHQQESDPSILADTSADQTTPMHIQPGVTVSHEDTFLWVMAGNHPQGGSLNQGLSPTSGRVHLARPDRNQGWATFAANRRNSALKRRGERFRVLNGGISLDTKGLGERLELNRGVVDMYPIQPPRDVAHSSRRYRLLVRDVTPICLVIIYDDE